MFRVIVLERAANGLKEIGLVAERRKVEEALASLVTNPTEPPGLEAKERGGGWELHVGRWKITYEISDQEMVVYVHNIKERPSLAFDFR